MGNHGACALATGLTIALAFPGFAAIAAPRAELVNKLVECRTMTDPDKRLACYDAQVAALDAAEKSKDLVIMDRQQVRETRRSLFGFLLPQFNPGGDKAESADDIKEIDAAIISAQRTSGNGWSFVLSDGAGTWTTTDALFSPPRRGDKVHIKKGMMGGFLGSVGNSDGIRLRRVG